LRKCSVVVQRDKPLLPAWHETVPVAPAFSAAAPPSLSELLHVTASHDAAALSPPTAYIRLFTFCLVSTGSTVGWVSEVQTG